MVEVLALLRPMSHGRVAIAVVVVYGYANCGSDWRFRFGKNAIAVAIGSRYAAAVEVYHFDQSGIPPVEQMVREHGSGEAWQRAMTFNWTTKLAERLHPDARILFEGQMRLSFVREAADAAGIKDYIVMLVDCDDVTRTRRLIEDRSSLDLANATMMSWAKYLREEAKRSTA
jgi:hypothetical protein